MCIRRRCLADFNPQDSDTDSSVCLNVRSLFPHLSRLYGLTGRYTSAKFRLRMNIRNQHLRCWRRMCIRRRCLADFNPQDSDTDSSVCLNVRSLLPHLSRLYGLTGRYTSAKFRLRMCIRRRDSADEYSQPTFLPCTQPIHVLPGQDAYAAPEFVIPYSLGKIQPTFFEGRPTSPGDHHP